MKKGGLLLLAVILVLAFASFVSAGCCSYPNVNPYCSFDSSMTLDDCCDSTLPNADYLDCIQYHFNSESCEGIGCNTNCCINENAPNQGQCDQGNCAQGSNYFVNEGDCNYNLGGNCEVGCCCSTTGQGGQSNTVAHDDVSKFYCDYLINNGVWKGAVSDCNQECGVNNGNPECNDGIDNDGDGLVDYNVVPGMGDPGCESLSDNDENNCGDSNVNGDEQCDGTVGCLDCSCDTSLGYSYVNGYCVLQNTCDGEWNPPETDNVVCDGGENCNDDCTCESGYVPSSSQGNVKGCELPVPSCGNGVIDDGEECDSGNYCLNCECQDGHNPTNPISVNCEGDVVLPECSDGMDNDNDGLIDLADPGCHNDPDFPSESSCPTGTQGYGEDGCACTYFETNNQCTCEDNENDGCPEEPNECEPPNECVNPDQNDGLFCNATNEIVLDCRGDTWNSENPQNQCGCPDGTTCNLETGLCDYKPEICDNGKDDNNNRFIDCNDNNGCYHGQTCNGHLEGETPVSGKNCVYQPDPNENEFQCCKNPKDCDGDDIFEQCGGVCDECSGVNGDLPLPELIGVMDVPHKAELNLFWKIDSKCEGKLESFTIKDCVLDSPTPDSGTPEELKNYEPLAGSNRDGISDNLGLCDGKWEDDGDINFNGNLDELQFTDKFGLNNVGKTICYKVQANYGSDVTLSSNMVCETVSDLECISPEPPSTFCQEGDDNINKIFDCGWFPEEASDKDTYIIQEKEDCKDGKICITDAFDPNHEAMCYNKVDDCGVCNRPLGVFGTVGQSMMLTGTSCSDSLECYYDESPTANVDFFDECDVILGDDSNEGLGCYGYTSQKACEGFDSGTEGTYNNKCLSDRNCTWNWINKELGTGVCAEIDPKLQKCELCSGDFEPNLQKRFDNRRDSVFSACTVDTCKSFGLCYPQDLNNDGVIYDTSYEDETCISKSNSDCKTYANSKKDCIQTSSWNYLDEGFTNPWGTTESEDNSSINLDIEENNPGEGSNTYITHSFDYFGFGFCKYDDEKETCYNDPDDSEKSDSFSLMRDRTPPSSIISISPSKIGNLDSAEIDYVLKDYDEDGNECTRNFDKFTNPKNDPCSSVKTTKVSLVALDSPIKNSIQSNLVLENQVPGTDYFGLLHKPKFTTNSKLGGGAYLFDSNNHDYIEINGAIDELEKSSVTFSAWVNLTKQQSQTIIYRGSVPGQPEYGIRLGVDSQGKANFLVRDPSETSLVFSDEKLDLNVWNLLVGTFNKNNGQVCIWVNDVKKCAMPVDEIPLIETGNNFLIGKRDGSPSWATNGTIDEVAVWNDSLESDDINQLVNGENSSLVKPDNLIGYWDLNDEINSVCYNQAACSKCLIQKGLYSEHENDIFAISPDSFEDYCGKEDYKPANFIKLQSCIPTSCYSYPVETVNDANSFLDTFGGYPGADYAVYYFSKDYATHLEEVKVARFFLDTFAPVVTLQPEYAIQPGHLPALGSGDELKSNITIFINVSEKAYCWQIMNPIPQVQDPSSYNPDGLYNPEVDDNSFDKSQWGDNFTIDDAWTNHLIDTMHEGVSSSYFLDFPDGIYDYTVGCQDIFGNEDFKNFRIRVKADTRIKGVSPLVPVNKSRINLTIVTRNNVTCSLNSNQISGLQNLEIPEKNITLAYDENGFEIYEQRYEVNLTENGEYTVNVQCNYLPVAKDVIKFTYDTMQPYSITLDNAGIPYDFSLWKPQYYGIELSCRDFPNQASPFGCKRANYCISSKECDPYESGDETFNISENNGQVKGYVGQRITIPRYFCFSSEEKTDADYSLDEDLYKYLTVPQGGIKENKTCYYIPADEIEPVLNVLSLENYSATNPYPIKKSEIDSNFNFGFNGSVKDWDYDTNSIKVTTDNWNPLEHDNEPGMIFKTMDAYWNNDVSPIKTQEGYVFGNFSMNISFSLQDYDERPEFLYLLFRGEDNENFYSATIRLMQNDQAKMILHKKVNGGNLVQLPGQNSQSTNFEMVDNMNYTAVIFANGSNIKFDLYGPNGLIESVNSNDLTYKKGMIGEGISGPLDSTNSKSKVIINSVIVDDYNINMNNYISWRSYDAQGNPLYPLRTIDLPVNASKFRVNATFNASTNDSNSFYKLMVRGFDKANNKAEHDYYVYLATKGPEFTSLKFLGGANDGKEVNNETHYEMNSQDNVSFILSVKDEDFNEMHINVTNARVDVANISTEMTYIGDSGNNEKIYYWNVSLNINSLGTGIYDFIVTAGDEVGNYNSKTYYLNVSDTIAPIFNMSVYRDANFSEFVNTTIGLGRYYVKVNASERSRLDELSFTNDFNSQTIKATCGDQGNYVTEWECTFIVPYLGFWGKVGEANFAINGSDIAGNEQEEINPSLYLFNGIGPNYIYFDPSFADEEQSPNFYHNVYSNMLKYYGGVHDDLDVFVTAQDSLFISGFSLGAKSITLETEDASANYNIPSTVQLEDDYAIMSYKREKGALELSLDGDLRGTAYATPGNYVGFVNDDLIRTSYENYNQYYRIESFYYQSGNSYVTIYPALEFNVSAGESLAVYDKLTPADYFGLYSPIFKSGYNEFYAKASDGYSYSVSPHYYIMLDKVAPLFVTSDYYPFDGWYVNNYDENENQYKLTNINLTVVDSLPSSGIYLENTLINVTYEGNLVYSGPLTGVEEHDEGIHAVYKLNLDLNAIDYQDERINGGVYHIDAKVMDGAMNPAYFSFGFTAINGMEDYPFLTLEKENGTRYNNSYDLYPYPNPNYFVKGIVNSVQNSQVGFELKFNENVFNLNVSNDLSAVTCIDNLDYTYNCSFDDMFAGLNPDVEKEIVHNMNITFENEDGEVRSVVYKFVVDSAPVTLNKIIAPKKVKSNSSFDIGLDVEFTYDSFPINVSMVISNGTDEFDVGKTIVLLGEDVSFANAFIPENVSEGNYTLIATAVDQAGNSVKKYKTIVVDNTPPEISVTSVESINPEKKTLNLEGWRTTDNEVLVRLSTNENLSLLCYDDGPNGCDITKLDDVSGNTFIFNIGLVGLNQAEILNSINFIAKDLAGNQQELTLNVTTDHLGPQIQDIGGDLTFENPLYVEFNENVSDINTYIFRGDERFNLIKIENESNTFFEFVKGAILENGTYSWAFNVTDSLGNLAAYNENWDVYTFVYEGESFKIELEHPTYGWSAEPVFDLMIKTNYPAKCRYSYAGNVYNYDNFPNNFTTTDGYEHYVYGYEMIDSKEKIYVKCKDEFGGQSPAGENNKPFTLVWNDDEVEILDAYASPYAIVDETNGKYVTEFNVVTDIPSLCRYDIDASNEFDLMSEENTFPGIGQKEEGTGYVHKVDMDKQNVIDTYVYDVSCKSLANISNIAPVQIEFKIDPFADLEVGILSPKGNVLTSDENEEFVLRLKANRNAECSYQFNDSSSSVSFNLDGNVEKEFNLGSFHSNRWDEGTIGLDINCTSDQGSFNVQRLFTLDTSLGKFGLEVYEDSGRNEKIDPELDTLGLGTYYLIVSSDEPTTMELSLKSDFNHDNEYEEIQANCPNPDGRQKQRYCEIDIPYEGYWNYSGRVGFVALGNDSVGNIQTGVEPSLYYFDGSKLNYKMNMTLPTYGWSADEVFDIEIETDIEASCRYDFSSNFKHYNLMGHDFVDSADGLKHTINSYNISELGNKIYVTCVDEYGRQFPPNNRRFKLTWDDDAPTIISAIADPSIIIDDNGQGQYETQFKVTTNNQTLCRYDYGNGIDNYTRMSPDNQFVFPAMKNLDTGYYENTVVINNQTVPNNYSYNISCSSYADVISSPAQIDFKIDPFYGLLFELVSPDSTYITSDSSENIVYTLKTNKGAECYWYLNTTKVPIVFTMKANKEEKINIGTLKKEGWVEFTATCTAENVERTINALVALDTSVPKISNVTVDDISCRDSRLEINEILFENGISPIEAVEYRLLKFSNNEVLVDWDSTSSTQNIKVDEYDNGSHFGLIDGTKYYFEVRANNTVVNGWSPVVDSNSILVDLDNEKCVRCGDGECNALFEDCSTCASDCGVCGPECENGQKDVGETGIDCGGSSCPKCTVGDTCSLNSDCVSDVCDNGVCALPLCENLVLNSDNGESDIDCGGNNCDGCSEGKNCFTKEDCAGDNYCNSLGVCTAPTCSDNNLNQDETGIDCGGTCALVYSQLCSLGDGCNSPSDCESGYCDQSTLTCAKAGCDDNIKNGNETGRDCGGSCGPCDDDEPCEIDSDCKSSVCKDKVCITDKDKDTDGDGLPDWWETKYGLNPNDPSDASLDKDGDGLSNYKEYTYQYGSLDPNNPDTDGDGVFDMVEIQKGTDPLDASSFPKSSSSWWSIILLVVLIIGVLGGGGYYAYLHYYTPPVPPMMGAGPKPRRKQMFSNSKGRRVVAPPKRVSLFEQKEVKKNTERSKLFDSFDTKEEAVKAEIPSKETTKVEEVKIDTKGNKINKPEWIDLTQKADKKDTVFKKLSKINKTPNSKSAFDELESVKDETIPEVRVANEKLTLREKMGHSSLNKLRRMNSKDSISTLKKMDDGKSEGDVFSKLKKMNKGKKRHVGKK